MKKTKPAGRFFRNHWLMGLIILQPILDIIAFWTKSPDGTFAGLVRLLVMLAFPITLLIVLRERKRHGQGLRAHLLLPCRLGNVQG